jgi:epoxyqueuosine reductase
MDRRSFAIHSIAQSPFTRSPDGPITRWYDALVMLLTGLSRGIRVHALEAGFDLAGVAPLAAWQDLEFARTWAEKGYGGEMAYLRNPKRADPRLILPSARSVVCVGLVYNAALPYSTEVAGLRDSGLATRGPGFGIRGSGLMIGSNRLKPRSHVPRTTNNELMRKSRTASPEHRKPNTEPRVPSPEPRGWISRYAWGRDYHQVMRSRLERLRTAIEKLAPGVETRVYVDTGPIVERAFARLSGIGWVGKNTCLINQQKGSWFFLGVILTSLELEPDSPAFDRCGSCTRCLDACPTGALVEPYVMNASRCIAYLNIELKGPIPVDLRTAIGSNVFGCDICQDVCPWNGGSLFVARGSLSSEQPSAFSDQPSATKSRPQKSVPTRVRRAAVTSLTEFQPLAVELVPQPQAIPPRTTNYEPRTVASEERTISLFRPRLEDLASLTEEEFRRFFRDSPIKRAKYRGWLRNLCVVMGNSGDARFIPWLEQTMREQEDMIVREHAEWALQRLILRRTRDCQKSEVRSQESEAAS